ncbi:MAG: hypothetical protein NWR36_00665, partial [Opitutales bacterium]|nr:hypothetical protein [Opitutales bacterium]
TWVRKDFAKASDAKKGEKICVLITQFELSEENIREKLQTIDLPNLWKPNPKDWCRVEALPMLGTGKQDFRAMKTLVEEMVD